MVTHMPPLPQFIDVPRPPKRRRLEMPVVADGFNARPRRPAVPPVVSAPLKHVLPPAFSLPPARQLYPPRPPPLPTPDRDRDRDLNTISTGLLNSSNGGEDLTAKHVLPPTFSLPPARQLHPPRPPPLPTRDRDRDLKTISTTSIGLLNSSSGGEDLAAKHVLPPTFSLPLARQLHPPRPPLLPTPVRDRDLKTISTTSIGLLNSLSSSNGGEDLAAFLLPHRDQSAPTPRGIDLSPEKKGKKFIRGGLAARASTLFNRAHTSLVLWQKDTERRATNLPHLSATLVRILHLHTKPSVIIALCRIHHHTDSSYAPNQLYKIIFSVPPHLPLGRIKEGLTIRIFHPCHELSSASSSPAQLPLPLSLPLTPDLPINSTTTLFCSRFIF